MKVNNKQLIVLFLLITVFLSSCQDGEDIAGATGYGQLKIKSTFSAGASPILVQIDGETKDTLSETKSSISGMILKEGLRKYKLIKETDQQILLDTDINILPGKMTVADAFMYNGETALFDDELDKWPQQDSMLVRFVTTDPILPDRMDIDILLYYNSGGVKLISLGKTIQGVTKDKFSEFIQLPYPVLLSPTGARYARYLIEGYDSDTKEKVMIYSITNTANNTAAVFPSSIPPTYSSISSINKGTVALSIGIGASTGSNLLHQCSIVFWRVP